MAAVFFGFRTVRGACFAGLQSPLETPKTDPILGLKRSDIRLRKSRL